MYRMSFSSMPATSAISLQYAIIRSVTHSRAAAVARDHGKVLNVHGRASSVPNQHTREVLFMYSWCYDRCHTCLSASILHLGAGTAFGPAPAM